MSARRTYREITHLDPVETFDLPGPRVLPLVRIRIGRAGDRWYSVADASHATGGFGGPLGYYPHDPDFGADTSREDAIYSAIEQARRHLGWAPKETVKHRAWLDELEEREVRQKDLFAGLGS